MLKLPLVKLNWRPVLVGTLALASMLIPSYSAYLGALSATIQSSESYNAQQPALEVVPTWGCTHVQAKTSDQR